jgi:coenzyme Q-binding protein COQ10
MPSHTEEHFSPYTPYQIYKLVMDIEHYPEFLPWCTAAKILEKKGNTLIADLTIHFKGYTETFTSKVTLHPPGKGEDGEPGVVRAELMKGPFNHLLNLWELMPEGGGTRIRFAIDFDFKSKMLGKMIGFMFGSAMAKMVAAFEKRAQALYGV